MNLKTTVFTALAATFGLTLAAGSAQAASIAQIFAANPNFQIEDDSAESQNVDQAGAICDVVANPGGCTAGILDVGDTLRGIVEFPQLVNLDTTDITLLTPLVGNSNLAAVFEVEVLSKTLSAVQNPLTPGLDYDFVFGVHADFANGPDGIAGNADDYPVGTMIAFFEDNVDNVTRGGATCTSTAPGGNCEDNVTDGTFIIALGFDDASGNAEKDEAWVALGAPDSPSSGNLFSSSSAIGQFNFQLTDLFSAVGGFAANKNTLIPVVGGDGKISWLGSGSVLGSNDINTPYDITDDSDLTAEVPEPGTLGLMGAGLLALAGFARRKFRKAA